MNKLKDNLIKHSVIKDVFKYSGLETEYIDRYTYFENTFNTLFEGYASAFKLKGCLFYIENDSRCNAFARRIEGYNIIGITSGYVVCLDKLFERDYHKQILLLALKNNVVTSEAYCDLIQRPEFNLNKFTLDCSINFTFGHEFRHILQTNTENILSDFNFSEIINASTYNLKNHVWEFDADRLASFQVIRHIFNVKNELKIKNNEEIKCLLYIGMSSIIITKLLFYFGLTNVVTPTEVEKTPFYMKEKSHPHPFARILYIFDFYFENLEAILPKTSVKKQELLNNSLMISRIYLNSIIANKNLIEIFLDDLNNYDQINDFNTELYDSALKDKTIKFLWDNKGAHFWGN